MNNRALLLATFVAVLILAGCASSADRSETQGQAPILVQRTPVPAAITQGPIPTAVPIATWVAEGVPEDTIIKYRFEYGLLVPVSQLYGDQLITAVDKVIAADGTVTFTWQLNGPGKSRIIERGQVSQDELKRLLLKFAEIDFYSLTNTDTSLMYCVRYLSDPPWPEDTKEILDDGQQIVTVSLTMRGMQKTIKTWPYAATSCPQVYQRATQMLTSLTTLLQAPRRPPGATQPAPTATTLPTPTSSQPMPTNVSP